MLADTDDHLTRLSPVILNLESTGLTHLESEIQEKTKTLTYYDVHNYSFKILLPFLISSNPPDNSL